MHLPLPQTRRFLRNGAAFVSPAWTLGHAVKMVSTGKARGSIGSLVKKL